jgi:hypothetical protein
MRIGSKFLAAAVLCGVFGAGALPAMAQSSPSSMSEVQGATTGLGSSHRFATAQAATQHCPGDTIVWASRAKLSYALPGSPTYGTSKNGFYACKMEADSAGFTPHGD